MAMIARERTSVLCLRAPGELLMIELQDPTTGKRFMSFPGGQLEAGETAAVCAIRETLEETGYAVNLVSEALRTRYTFRWNARVYDCHCHWYLATCNGQAGPVDDADYLRGSHWLPVSRALQLLSYHPHIETVSRQLCDSAPARSFYHV